MIHELLASIVGSNDSIWSAWRSSTIWTTYAFLSRVCSHSSPLSLALIKISSYIPICFFKQNHRRAAYCIKEKEPRQALYNHIQKRSKKTATTPKPRLRNSLHQTRKNKLKKCALHPPLPTLLPHP